jgi:cyclopropane fatty-acyl-phospholipid synthase-like methyltransferase
LKLSQKITKLATRETYQRSWRKVRRRLSPIRIAPLLAQIDHTELRAIQQRYASSPLNYAKYADVARWLRRHVAKVQDLRLHRAAPKQILDLGCGGGFFLFICRHYGHSVTGLDLDEFPLLRELTGLLQVPRVNWTIEPFQSLPDFGQKFDLITAFSTRFNRDREDRFIWGLEEWGFFLDDLSSRLAPGGQVFFEINSGKDSRYYPDDLKEFFKTRGATLERDYVFFPRGILPSYKASPDIKS